MRLKTADGGLAIHREHQLRGHTAVMPSEYRLRTGTTSDLAVIKRILYKATTWDSKPAPALEIVMEHPELVRYHHGWGRKGDVAVIANHGDEVVGGAMCRLFTEDDHGHGFIDESTPELGIAVWDGHRGKGLGGRLMDALEESAASRLGCHALSLSVNHGNPAVRLYERHGYTTVSEDESSLLMVKRLG